MPYRNIACLLRDTIIARIDDRVASMGAAITALLFSLGKSLIALYLAITPITSVSGTAGSVIAGLLWVYYSAQIFFLGTKFTKLYAYRYGSHKPPEPRTASSAEARSG
ncbi:MAG: YhjD/YihY/BrkB family envelope integrity protein [Pseudomonadota bacterium]